MPNRKQVPSRFRVGVPVRVSRHAYQDSNDPLDLATRNATGVIVAPANHQWWRVRIDGTEDTCLLWDEEMEVIRE